MVKSSERVFCDGARAHTPEKRIERNCSNETAKSGENSESVLRCVYTPGEEPRGAVLKSQEGALLVQL